MGIGNIKVVFQSCTALVVAVKDSNSNSATIDPSAKALVPAVLAVNLQNGGGLWLLGK
ncbi:MAG: hypothetical protein HFF06_10915 [Oscillospiraceae bacterium]|nr:hypothetical protein [Oscillospiraceae bacterium]